jgi:hypothetical protein
METPMYPSWSELLSILAALRRCGWGIVLDESGSLTPLPTIPVAHLLASCLVASSGLEAAVRQTLSAPNQEAGLPSPIAASAAANPSCPAGATTSPSGLSANGPSCSPGQKSDSPAKEVFYCLCCGLRFTSRPMPPAPFCPRCGQPGRQLSWLGIAYLGSALKC